MGSPGLPKPVISLERGVDFRKVTETWGLVQWGYGVRWVWGVRMAARWGLPGGNWGGGFETGVGREEGRSVVVSSMSVEQLQVSTKPTGVYASAFVGEGKDRVVVGLGWVLKVAWCV